MEHLILLIQQYGYIIVFFLSLLEGETVVALAGIAAYEGYLDLGMVIAIAIIGAILGDQFFFYFGRYKGRKFLERRPKLLARAARMHKLLERYPGWMTFGSRFMYGFRTIVPIALGTSKISGMRFFFFNLLGAVVWGSLFPVAGYMFGSAIERFIVHVKRAEKYVIIGIVIGIVIAQLIFFIRRRFAAKVEEELSEVEQELEEGETTV